MIGYILTEAEKDTIQGQHFSTSTCFNCVQDINGIWFNFITEQQIPQVKASEYAWVFDLPTAEYTPPPSPDII
jgi:hypothetical protein